MKMVVKMAAATLLLAPVAVQAQLIRERVDGDRRICTYYGSDRLPNDQVVARELSLALGQECPATAPYHDPSMPPPSNAALVRESQDNGQRLCIYGQGGQEWWVPVAFTERCAMTPALLAAQRASAAQTTTP